MNVKFNKIVRKKEIKIRKMRMILTKFIYILVKVRTIIRIWVKKQSNSYLNTLKKMKK